MKADLDRRSTIESFIKAPKGPNQKTWIALATCPFGDQLQQTNIENWVEKWHAFVIMVLAPESGYGKRVVLWDCDAKAGVTSETRIKDALTGRQHKF